MQQHSVIYVLVLSAISTTVSAAFKAALPQITPAARPPLARRQDLCPAGWLGCPTDGACCEIGTTCSTNDAGIPICIVPECVPGIVACTEGPISGVCCLQGSTCAFSTCEAGSPTGVSIPLGPGPVSVSSGPVVSEPATTDATPTPTEGPPEVTNSSESSSLVEPTETGDGGQTVSTNSGNEATSTGGGELPVTTSVGNTRTSVLNGLDLRLLALDGLNL